MATNPKIRSYVAEHQSAFLEDLYSLIRIPSVSAQPEHKPDMDRCAARWQELLIAAGMHRAEVLPTVGNPVVFAEYHYSDDAPTVLVYGHYDVMPEAPEELWHTSPFEPEIIDGNIYARGADDDKGQSMTQVKGFQTALELGLVRTNVKVLLEGEEEIGSPSLEAFCQEHKELLSADFILVSDTGIISEAQPSITVGLRGLAYWEIEVVGPNRDLHSGHYGGAVANPLNELCKLIAKMTDDDHRITIPGFYDRVVHLSDEERRQIAAAPFDEDAFCASIDIPRAQGEAGYTTQERRGARPSFDLCGIWGGYTGDGAKTVLPSKATAKVSTRLVADQDYEEVSQMLVDYVAAIAPDTVRVTVKPLHGGAAYLCPTSHPAYRVAEEAYEATFGAKPLATRSGGSIPIIATFERVLGIKSILMGFGLDSDAIHSPNEHFPLSLFTKGIETVAEFYARFGHEGK